MHAVIEVFEAGSSQIDNVEITGGASGGVVNFEGSLTMTGDLVDHNTAGGGNANGAGINNDATLTIAQSTITANHATGATGAGGSGSGNGVSGDGADGAGVNSGGGTLTITDSTIANNIAQGGAGGDVTGTGTAGSGTDAVGGGIELEGTATTTFVIVNTTITGNTASGGQDGSSPGGGTLASNLGEGGGVDLSEPGQATLANVTLVGNGVTGGGSTGGGNLYMEAESNESLDLADTIIADGTVSSGGTGANCYLKFNPDVVDLEANLEDSGTGTSECGLSPSTDHLVAAGGAGVATALANRGGFTDTLPLLDASPAISSAGLARIRRMAMRRC